MWGGYKGQIRMNLVTDTNLIRMLTNPCIPYSVYIRLVSYHPVRQYDGDFAIHDALVCNDLSNY